MQRFLSEGLYYMRRSKRARRFTTYSIKRKPKTNDSLPRHPFVIPVVMFLLFFVLFSIAFVSLGGTTVGPTDTRIVTVSINDQEQVVPTRAKTVRELFERMNIQVGEKDIVEPGLETEIANQDFMVKLYRVRTVKVQHKDREVVLETAEPVPEDVAKQAGFQVFPEDRVVKAPVVDPLEAFREGLVAERVIVEPATLVYLNLYGIPFEVRTHAATINDLLEERKITTATTDTVQPSPDTQITDGLQIFIVPQGRQIAIQELPVEPPIERREDPGLDVGRTVVLQPGVPGKRAVTYEIELQNGKEVARREIQNVIIQQPLPRIIKVGTKRKTFSGSFEAALAALRGCESGGNYSINTGNGYYGAYQYNLSTWNNYAGYRYPHEAPPYIQDQKAWETYQRRGWQPWPSCSQKLGLQDVYR